MITEHEQVDSQVVDQISRTLMDKSSNYSTVDLLDAYGKDFYLDELLKDNY